LKVFPKKLLGPEARHIEGTNWAPSGAGVRGVAANRRWNSYVLFERRPGRKRRDGSPCEPSLARWMDMLPLPRLAVSVPTTKLRYCYIRYRNISLQYSFATVASLYVCNSTGFSGLHTEQPNERFAH
jgi:hypothetical protein